MPRPVYERNGYKMIDRDTIHFIDCSGEVIKVYNRREYNNILVWNSLIAQVKSYPLGKEIVYISNDDMVRIDRTIFACYILDDLIEL